MLRLKIKSFFAKKSAEFPGLDADGLERLEVVAQVRGETPAAVYKRFGKNLIASAPRSFSKHIPALRRTAFKSLSMVDGYACAVLPNGLTFWGYQSKPHHQRCYDYVNDLLPDIVTRETFLLGLDIAQRYATDYSWPSPSIAPPAEGHVIEFGAYLGHKTVRFADELLRRKGRVLAVEMMPDNVELLRRNVEANKLQKVIEVVEAGVWNETGTLPVMGKGRQRNTLVDLEKLEDERKVDVRVDTVDNFIREWGVQRVDLIFMTVNGAEVEALSAWKDTVSMVNGIFVAAPYERDGRQSVDICRELLQSKGFEILPESKQRTLIAKYKGGMKS